MPKKDPYSSSLDSYYHQLIQDFPELTITALRRIGSGWDHIALEANGGIVFRIPEDLRFDAEQLECVAYETAVLQKLQNKLPTRIPEPKYVAPHGGYFGYSILKGILAQEAWPQLSAQRQAYLREDWVSVVVAIEQAMPVAEARSLGVPLFWLEGIRNDARKLLQLSNLPLQYKQFAQWTLARAESLNVNEKPFFLHNDFFLHNMLLNQVTDRLSALIDWSDCCIAPIEREFALWHWLPAEQLDALAALYTEKTGRSIDKDAVKTWKYIEACSDTYTQLAENDQAGYRESLQHIDRWIREEGLSFK